MKKNKYGEQTVVIRVPKSRKLDVLNFLKSFEVLDDFGMGTPPTDHLRNAYLKGFNDCFERWELYNLSLPLILTGKQSHLPLLKDLYERAIPESAFMFPCKNIFQSCLTQRRFQNFQHWHWLNNFSVNLLIKPESNLNRLKYPQIFQTW